MNRYKSVTKSLPQDSTVQDNTPINSPKGEQSAARGKRKRTRDQPDGDYYLEQAKRRIAKTRELCEAARDGGGGGLPENWREALHGGTNGQE